MSFAYDLDDYKQSRGLYIDLPSELPCGIVKTEDEVISQIKSMDYSDSCKRVKLFKEKFVPVGGHATEMCVNALFCE